MFLQHMLLMSFQSDCDEDHRTVQRSVHTQRFRKQKRNWSFVVNFVSHLVRVPLYWCESESDISSSLVHRESNLILIMSSDKDQLRRKSLSLIVNESYKQMGRIPISNMTICIFGIRIHISIAQCERILKRNTHGCVKQFSQIFKLYFDLIFVCRTCMKI